MKMWFKLAGAGLFIFSLLNACQEGSNTNLADAGGEKLYKKHCNRCHGMDGKKGRKGAKDLTKSDKDLAFRINQITEGEDEMPSFSDRMSAQQIETVAKYTLERFPITTELNASTLDD